LRLTKSFAPTAPLVPSGLGVRLGSHAFAAYERLRRPRVEKIIAEANKTNANKAPGPVGRVLRDALLGRAPAWLPSARSCDRETSVWISD